jgi:hypothetical protein
MNSLIRKILGKHFTSEQWADFFVKETAESAGRVFNDSQFQKQARVKECSEEEYNRIFNEVQVTGIVYGILLVEDRARYADDGRESHWRDVAEKIPEIFCQWLGELGIPQEFVDIWKKLIDLRLDEYRQGTFETKDMLERQENDLQEGEKTILARLETVAVLSMLHITRGKAKPDDPLKKHLMTWLASLEANLSKNIR